MYLRKSRAEDGQNTSEILRRHRETLSEYAARNGVRVLETYQEIKSGESLYARPEMLRLLEAVEAGRYQAVLCMDIDRLSRGETRERGRIWATFKEAGVLIVTPGKTYDLSEESDELMTELRGLFANFELRKIKERTHRGMLRAAKEGCYLNYAPYGYRKRVIDKKKTLEIYEPEARLVRLMFEWYASGIGCDTIARRLNEMGARPRRSDAFVRLGVMKIIKNPVYTGTIVYNRQKWRRKDGKITVAVRPESEWVVSDGLHPALISKELYDRCQDILKGRYKPPTYDGTIKTSLVGLIRCEKCGKRMEKMSHNGKYYIHCLTRGCCVASLYDLVEGRVIDILEEELSRLEADPDEASGAAAEAAEERLAAVNAALDAARRKKTRLYEFLEDGTYSKEVFRERMNALKNQIAALERQAADAEADRDAALRVDASRQARELRNALETYWDADAPGRNALLRKVVDVIWYRREKGTKKSEFSLRIVLRYEC